MGVAKKSIFINSPIEKIHEYNTDLTKLSEWYTNILGPDKVTGDGNKGTIVEMKYSLLGVHIPMTMEVLENTMNLWKAKFSGAASGEQLVECETKDGGTEVTITTTFTIPKSVLAKVANTTIVEKLVENALAHTLENLKMICEMEE